MKRDQIFPSRFAKAADVPKPVVVEITSAEPETLKDMSGKEQQKIVLGFKGWKKQLVLNATNWDSIVDILAEADSDNWIGGRIELYPHKTQMPGRGVVDCVRVRAPSQAELPVAKPKKTPVAARPPLAEELDDEVPFA